MTAPITAPQLAILRSEPQWSELMLAGLENPTVVFAARVNQTFTTFDQIAEVIYDTVTTGAYADVLVGMTLWVGSAAGLYDIGQIRIRKAATSTKLFFGEESDIEWANNLYLTVVDEMDIWPKHARIASGVTKMDYDVTYSDQHEDFDPVPVMGPPAVMDVASYPVTVKFPGAADSWVFDSSISAHLWTATAGSLAGSTTNDPTLTISAYPANGRIRVAYRVTAANGKQFTGYRYVYVYDSTHRPHTDFQLGSCGISYEEGGWSFEVTLFANATLASIRDRAPIILFAKDHYGPAGADVISLGHLEDRENIVAMGWVDGESISWNAEFSSVRFTVQGPQFWLNKISGFPPGVEMAKRTPTAWKFVTGLTVDRALWHLLHWRSTATAVMDVRLTDDDRYASAFVIPTQSLWAQMNEIAAKSIFAVPGCDRYGRLCVEIEPQMIPEAERTWVEIMEILPTDRRDEIEIKHTDINQVGMVDFSGNSINASGKGHPWYSLANGHIFTRFGGIQISDGFLLESQAQANQLAGLAMGRANNEFPNFVIRLAENNRMIDLFPRQYLTIDIQPGDTVRGITYTGRLIPRNITLEVDAETGSLLSTIEAEPESFEQIAITGDTPASTSVPPVSPPPLPPLPPPIIPGDIPEEGPSMVIIATDLGIVYSETLNEADPDWFFMNSGLTVAESKNVLDIKVCPSGLILILIDDTAQGGRQGQSVYYAEGLGGTWKLFFERYTLGTGGGLTPYIQAIGVNPNKDEEILLLGSTGPVGNAKTYLGDRDGLVLKSSAGNPIGQEMGGVSYGFDEWFASVAANASPRRAAYMKISAAGYITTNATNYATNGSNPSDHWHHRGGGSCFVYESNGDRLRIVDDSDPSVENLVTLAVDFNPDKVSGFAVSPSGARLMGGNSAVITQRSSDGGYTWGNVGTGGGFGVGANCYENCGDDNWWLAGAVTLWITKDFGDSWRNVSGNLSYTLFGAQFKVIRCIK